MWLCDGICAVLSVVAWIETPLHCMPSHTHGASTHVNNGGGAFGGGIIRDNTTLYTFATGGSQAHTHPATASSSIETIPPYYTLVYCVKLI